MLDDSAERLKETVARNIRAELERLGWTHRQLADMIDRDRATVTQYANADRLPPPEVLERISRALRPEENGSVDWLFGIYPRRMTADAKELLIEYEGIRHPVYRRMARDAVRALRRADRELAAPEGAPD